MFAEFWDMIKKPVFFWKSKLYQILFTVKQFLMLWLMYKPRVLTAPRLQIQRTSNKGNIFLNFISIVIITGDGAT